MPTPAERQALLFLALILTLGVGVRVMRRPTPAPVETDAGGLARQLAAVDSAVAVRRGSGKAPRGQASPAVRPIAPSAPPAPAVVDLDTAPDSLLVSLPGIGPALARRIVEDRGRHGPFGSLDALTRVPGIGAKTAERLRPRVTFSFPPRRIP